MLVNKLLYFALIQFRLLIHSVAMITSGQNDNFRILGVCFLKSIEHFLHILIAARRQKDGITALGYMLDSFKIFYTISKFFFEFLNCIICYFFSVALKKLPGNVFEKAFNAIAHLAIERETGARGLRSILEGIMMKPMFDLPGREDVKTVTVTKGYVNGTEDLKLEFK